MLRASYIFGSSRFCRANSAGRSGPFQIVTMPQATAAIGTARTAPTMPPTMVPAVRAMSTTSGCSDSERAMTTGCRKFPSSWLTSDHDDDDDDGAATGPFATRATRAARIPATVAPTRGTKAERNTITDERKREGHTEGEEPDADADGVDEGHGRRAADVPAERRHRLLADALGTLELLAGEGALA